MAFSSVTADNKKKKQYAPADNPLEKVELAGKQIADEFIAAPVGAIVDEALAQIGLKPQRKPMSGEFNLAAGTHKVNEQAAKVDQKDATIEAKMRQLQYVQRNEKEVFNSKQKALEGQIGQLMQELQKEVAKLQMQTAELTNDVRKVTVETRPNAGKMGIYHLNFFDQVMLMLRDLRKSVSESRQWLHAWSQKKKQKGYWAMFKKHGNNFAMSDERGIATSNG